MAKIIIKKRVELGFLGDEYKDDYLVFSAIPVKEYKEMVNNRPEEDDSQYEYVVKVLQSKFLEGSFGGEAVTKDDLGDFDGETALLCFGRLTGQDIDPKV